MVFKTGLLQHLEDLEDLEKSLNFKKLLKTWKSHGVSKKWLEILYSRLFQTLNNYFRILEQILNLKIFFSLFKNIIEKFRIQSFIVKKWFFLSQNELQLILIRFFLKVDLDFFCKIRLGKPGKVMEF